VQSLPDIFPLRALELRRAVSRTSASQLEAHLQAASVEQFLENGIIVERSAWQQKGAHDSIPSAHTPTLKWTGYPRMRIACPGVTVVNG
jgi:hypothetical protein